MTMRNRRHGNECSPQCRHSGAGRNPALVRAGRGLDTGLRRYDDGWWCDERRYADAEWWRGVATCAGVAKEEHRHDDAQSST